MTYQELEADVIELRQRQRRHKELLRRLYGHFTAITDKLELRIKNMAATITDVQNNLATLKTKLDALIAKANGAATQEQVDAVNTAVVGLISEVDAANPPPPPPPPAPPAQ